MTTTYVNRNCHCYRYCYCITETSCFSNGFCVSFEVFAVFVDSYYSLFRIGYMEQTKQNSINFLSQAMKSSPSLFYFLKVGDLAQGTVLDKSARTLVIDLEKYGTGIVYRAEMQNAKEMVKHLNVGDPVTAKVIAVDNEDGAIELSLTEADKQKSWAAVAELKEREEVIAVTVTGYNKGGLTATMNDLQAFLPISQLSNEHCPNVSFDDKAKLAEALKALLGQELKVKITDANPRTNKLIISEREANVISMKELAKNYTVGQIIDGIVSGVADFGVFVKFTDNPAVEGLVHVSELDYRVVENPKEIIHVDDTVKAKIIDIAGGKISLSLKALKADPWESVGETYKEGGEVHGTVYSFNPFGAIIDLGGGIQGHLHVSTFGSVEEMKKQLVLGKEYAFVIQEVKIPEKRISLKLKK